MTEYFKRVREPFAWAVLAVLVASMVLGVVQTVRQVQAEVPVFAAFQAIGGNLMNISVVLILIVLVCTCLFVSPATRNALLITKLAAWVVTVGVAATLAVNVLGIFATPNFFAVMVEVLGGLVDLVLKALGAGALWVLARGVDAGRIEAASASTGTLVRPESPEPVPATVWQPAEAVGTAWGTAADAAAGAPGRSRLDAVVPPTSDLSAGTSAPAESVADVAGSAAQEPS